MISLVVTRGFGNGTLTSNTNYIAVRGYLALRESHMVRLVKESKVIRL